MRVEPGVKLHGGESFINKLVEDPGLGLILYMNYGKVLSYLYRILYISNYVLVD